MRVLLGSEHFSIAAIPNSIIKSPLDYNMGMLKELEITSGYRTYWDGNEVHMNNLIPITLLFGARDRSNNTRS
ncbi:MAG: hypothetical protein CM15mP83_8870 [Flavobacteriaceae bacterium]|nr:MAG: hypothetical protein CM15mP83_8870 [Flavobacteriaceae bacterium]